MKSNRLLWWLFLLVMTIAHVGFGVVCVQMGYPSSVLGFMLICIGIVIGLLPVIEYRQGKGR